MGLIQLIIAALHERHPGLTPSIAGYFHEGACVCLSRHHAAPRDFEIDVDGSPSSGSVTWPKPSDPVWLAWGNKDDATRDGAYAISLATVEAHEGLVAVGRAETRSGADYLLAPREKAVEDFEASFRLEVSGIDNGTPAQISHRLVQKQEQARQGQSDLPAIAAVVEFKHSVVAVAYVRSVA